LADIEGNIEGVVEHLKRLKQNTGYI